MKTTTEINLTPNQLAECFINWGSDEQGKFINLIGKHFKECDFNSNLQICYMSDHIDKYGKDFLYTISNFVKVQKFDSTSKHFNHLIESY